MTSTQVSMTLARARLPHTHKAVRAGIAVAIVVVVAALCFWFVASGRGGALLDQEVRLVRNAWESTVATLVALWHWIA